MNLLLKVSVKIFMRVTTKNIVKNYKIIDYCHWVCDIFVHVNIIIDVAAAVAASVVVAAKMPV